MKQSHKLYTVKAYNSFGGGIGTYYAVATGVNKAKAAVKKSDKIIKRAVVIEEHQVILPEEHIVCTDKAFELWLAQLPKESK